MTNTSKLKAKIVENGLLQEQVAMQLGMTSATFNYKLNNKTEFKGSEIKMLIVILHLTADEVMAIFLLMMWIYNPHIKIKPKFKMKGWYRNEHFFTTIEKGNG